MAPLFLQKIPQLVNIGPVPLFVLQIVDAIANSCGGLQDLLAKIVAIFTDERRGRKEISDLTVGALTSLVPKAVEFIDRLSGLEVLPTIKKALLALQENVQGPINTAAKKILGPINDLVTSVAGVLPGASEFPVPPLTGEVDKELTGGGDSDTTATVHIDANGNTWVTASPSYRAKDLIDLYKAKRKFKHKKRDCKGDAVKLFGALDSKSLATAAQAIVNAGASKGGSGKSASNALNKSTKDAYKTLIDSNARMMRFFKDCGIPDVECIGLKTVILSKSDKTIQNIAKHIEDAQRRGKPKKLRYDARKAEEIKRRKQVCPDGYCDKDSVNDSCDEYPFATTREGGVYMGSPASRRCVPLSENHSQGGRVGGRFADGDRFCVIIIE